MAVRVSPVSKGAAILIIVIGIITLAGGLAAGEGYSIIFGSAFLVLGVALYRLLFRFAKKVERELDEGSKAS